MKVFDRKKCKLYLCLLLKIGKPCYTLIPYDYVNSIKLLENLIHWYHPFKSWISPQLSISVNNYWKFVFMIIAIRWRWKLSIGLFVNELFQFRLITEILFRYSKYTKYIQKTTDFFKETFKSSLYYLNGLISK